MRWNVCETCLEWPRTRHKVVQGQREKSNNTSVLTKKKKRNYKNDSWYSALLMYRCLAQSFSTEKLQPAADGNKYRYPQQEITVTVRTLGTFCPKWYMSIKSLPSKFRKSHGSEGGETVWGRGEGGHQGNKPSKSPWAKFTWSHRDKGSMTRNFWVCSRPPVE